MAKRQVTRGVVKHDGEVIEAGTPASKLPKGLKQHLKDNDFLMDEDAYKVYAGIEEPEDEEDNDTEVAGNGDDSVNEPGTEE